MIQVNPAIKRLLQRDAALEPHVDDIRMHLERYNAAVKTLAGKQPLTEVANGHLYYGFHRTQEGWVFREWLPGADAAWIYGDFNGWQPYTHPLTPLGNGDWEIRLTGHDALRHGQFVKLLVGRHGAVMERLPAYIRRTELDPNTSKLCGQIWMPDEPFGWTDQEWYGLKRPKNPLIYEVHVGMAQEKGGIGTYREFADFNLDWIAKCGYNAIQMMAIQEHPYYASFGYQVTNFFAPAHRFGTPEDLKYLINKAHGMGIAVILDVVHSHACPNPCEGLDGQDGTDDQYFHPGSRGWHPAWKTRCFNYGKPQVQHFLLSNLKYWLDEFHFDGFRFDGVTSMLYEDHGLGVAFSNYGQYYTLNTHVDARIYLMMANELVHKVNKKAITIAEDMSGMPGMCLPLGCGGFGFDYRLAMGMPDMWIKMIKEQRMEDWDIGKMWYELSNARPDEGTIGYAESHDQALVGDKTIIFRLADAEMYTGMHKDHHSPVIDTAMDMHKLIRFATATLSPNGYLNFMGNEFGHPEWIDFPREGNGWSYHYARRQWSLATDPNCKFEWLLNFDRDMIALINNTNLLSSQMKLLYINHDSKLLLFTRGNRIFAFNMHPTKSQKMAYIDANTLGAGEYKVVFSSDDAVYGGQGRIDKNYVYHTETEGNSLGFRMYLPCRTAVVLEKLPKGKKK